MKKGTKNKEKNQDKKNKDTKKENLLLQIKKEMSKVHFPSKSEMVKYSIATIVFIIFFGVYFYAIEIIMAFIKSLI